MSRPADLAASFGYEAPEPQWRTTSIPPVPPELFGSDHWSTFAYLEHCTVENRGMLHPDRLRVNGRRHLGFAQARRFGSGADGGRYPTRLAGGAEHRDHDDIDCIDDCIAAGLVQVQMPVARADRFVDAYGKTVRGGGGDVIDPKFVTGLDELSLCAYATFVLTERGRQVAAALRAHKADGGNFASFRMPA